MGLSWPPKIIFPLGGGKCESNTFSGLTTVLRLFAETMEDAQKLMGVKTMDLLNANLNQVLQSLCVMAGTFNGWKTRFNKYAKEEHCHFNLN